jgi:uncharacterized protein DUF6789
MKANIGKACLAGFIATTIVTFMIYFVSPYMTGGPSDLAGMLVGILNLSWILAIGVYYLIGALIMPLIYAQFLNPYLAGGPVLRGMTWGVLLWLVSQAIVVPATGGGMFSSATGGLRVVLESLLGHLVYGLVFGVWLGGPDEHTSERRHPIGSEPHARRAG